MLFNRSIVIFVSFCYLEFLLFFKFVILALRTLGRLKHLTALNVYYMIKEKSIETLKACIPSLIHVNRYPFSSIARPIVGFSRTSIWGCRLTDDQVRGIVATTAKALNDNK